MIYHCHSESFRSFKEEEEEEDNDWERDTQSIHKTVSSMGRRTVTMKYRMDTVQYRTHHLENSQKSLNSDLSKHNKTTQWFCVVWCLFIVIFFLSFCRVSCVCVCGSDINIENNNHNSLIVFIIYISFDYMYIYGEVCLCVSFFVISFSFRPKNVKKEEADWSENNLCECVCGCGVTGEGSAIIQPIFASFFSTKIETTEFYSFIQFCCCALLSHSFTRLPTHCCCPTHRCMRISFENVYDKYMCKKTLWRPDNSTPIFSTKWATATTTTSNGPAKYEIFFCCFFFVFLHFFFIVAWPPMLFVDFTTAWIMLTTGRMGVQAVGT